MIVAHYIARECALHPRSDPGVAALWNIPPRAMGGAKVDDVHQEVREARYAAAVARLADAAQRAPQEDRVIVIARAVAEYLAIPDAWMDAATGCRAWAYIEYPDWMEQPDIWVMALGVAYDVQRALSVDTGALLAEIERLRPPEEVDPGRMQMAVFPPCHPHVASMQILADLRHPTQRHAGSCACGARYAITRTTKLTDTPEGTQHSTTFEFERLA